VTLIGFIVNLDILFHDLGQKVLDSSIFKMLLLSQIQGLHCAEILATVSVRSSGLSAYRIILSSLNVWEGGNLDSGWEISCAD
jgi:hypothetical protein